jgi:hypothetical protein
LEIPLEVARKLNAMLLSRASPLGAMAGHDVLMIEQRTTVVVFFAKTKKAAANQRRFRAVFLTLVASARNIIEGQGGMKEEKRPRVGAVRTPDKVEALCVATQRIPRKSTGRAPRELGISRRSIQRILHSDLKLFPYKMFVLHKFSEHGKERRLQFAAWAEEENATFHNTWFSNETKFHLDGAVNKQNVLFWAREHPHNLRERSSHGRKVNI